MYVYFGSDLDRYNVETVIEGVPSSGILKISDKIS